MGAACFTATFGQLLWFEMGQKVMALPKRTWSDCILKRWAEHFDDILNQPSSINDEAINRLPQVECNPLLDELPTVSETVKAIKLLSSGKAPGTDAIPAEIYKAGRPQVAEILTELYHIMWRKEAIAQEVKDAIQTERESSSLWCLLI